MNEQMIYGLSIMTCLMGIAVVLVIRIFDKLGQSDASHPWYVRIARGHYACGARNEKVWAVKQLVKLLLAVIVLVAVSFVPVINTIAAAVILCIGTKLTAIYVAEW